MTKRPTTDDLRARIRSWDPAIDEDSDEFEAALVMLAALYLGTGHGAGRKLSEFSHVEYGRTLNIQRRLRGAGIWQNGGTVANWDDSQCGEASFWIDVGVATGNFSLKGRRKKTNDDAGGA